MNISLLIAGGGTGGHLFSGIAVADELRLRDSQARILFVGTPFGLEKDIVPKSGFDLEFIHATPLKGSGLMARVKSLLRLPRAYQQSKQIIKKFRPDVVLGIGGYASGPMTLAAHFSKIPTAIIEQNSIPGFTNRKLSRFVDRIFISFQNASKYFAASKTVFAGNPTRRLEALETVNMKDARFCIFVMGGSQGAHALNFAMIEALPFLSRERDQLNFIHQTGPKDRKEVEQAYAQAGMSADVFDFRADLGTAYAQSDLMLCRAGAGTITELQNKGKAAILVPYPFAADDHQLYNAKEMVAASAAELVLNQNLKGELLAQKIQAFLKDPEKIRGMEERARALAKPDAAARVLEELEKMAKKTRSREPRADSNFIQT